MRQVLSPRAMIFVPERKTLKIKYYETTKKSQKQIALGAFLRIQSIINLKINIMKNITLLLALTITMTAKAQYNNNNSLSNFFNNFPNSPSTATFLRYGDIQNSEFTGANSPRIPLYDIKEGNISLPLTLDYISGNGIKVSDEASNIGLGWNIGIPSITQSVLGYDDFDFSPELSKLKIDLHYQPTSPWPMMGYPDKFIETKDSPEPIGYIEDPQIGRYTYYYSLKHALPVNGNFLKHPTWLKYDTSPDIFTLNIFGDKIQFFVENHKDISSNQPEFVSLKKGYIIKFNKNNLSFEIIAPNGNIYEFSKSEKVEIFGVISRNYVLTKIKDTNQRTISIDYENYENITNFIPQSKNLNYTQDYTYSPTAGCGGIPVYNAGQYWYASPNNGIWPDNNNTQFAYYTGQTKGSYSVPVGPYYVSKQNYLLISKITGDFGQVNFNYSERDDFPTKKLNSIDIKSFNDNTNTKKISFISNTITAPDNINQNPDTAFMGNSRMKNRLILTEVIFNDIENYKFEYNNINSLPRKDSYAVDYWGYYNGGINNKSYFANPQDFDLSIPTIDLNNNKKKSDLNYATTGLLNKIIYPTKGYSIFNYELNSADNLFTNYNSLNITNGKGVRLANQTNYDSNNINLEKTKFIYEEGNSTNPLDLFKNINTNFIGSNIIIDGDISLTKASSYSFNVFSTNSTSNYSVSALSSGDYVGYKKVTKIQVDKNNIEKGRIISNYSFNADMNYRLWNDQLPVSIPSTQARGIENGKLLSRSIMDGNMKILKNISNQYDTNYSKVYYGTIFSPINKYLNLCNLQLGTSVSPTIFGGLSVVAHYPVFSKESLLSKTIEQEYSDNTIIETTTDFYYNENNNIILKSTKYPDQDYPLNKSIQYAKDKKNIKLIEANMINIPLKETQSLANYYSSKEVIYNATDHYNPTSIVSYGQYINGQSAAQTEFTYDKYDNKGNILQYSEKGVKPVTIIWGYNQTQPIAKIEGITYIELANKLGFSSNNIGYLNLDIVSKSNNDIDTSTEQLLIKDLDSFRNQPTLKGYPITTYTYNPLIGVTSITPPSGIREIYKYDLANRLESVKDIDGNLLKEYQYQYKKEVITHYNTEKSQPFTRNNCPAGTTPGIYNYIVPANKYSSVISKADAEQQAQNDINANGQIFANNNATCTPIITYYSTEKSQTFTKNNCSTGTTPGTYTYTVPANRYTSTVNQADADQKAQNDINANGQEQANLYATCTQTSCTFNPVTIGISATFTPSGSSNVYYNLNFSSSTKPYFNFDSKQNLLIGKIDPGCAPTSTFQIGKSEGGRYWMITIEPSGNFYLQLLNGSVNSGSFSISDSYSKNGSIN
ncbi:DUF5977 domain-containing protein [Elizabethkingia anophelis]|uniref:DUF5977 domain-containing protein n=1 Tax=Elizabethkingia anophelis TaxID=1117645 RepID=UPI00389192FA